VLLFLTIGQLEMFMTTNTSGYPDPAWN